MSLSPKISKPNYERLCNAMLIINKTPMHYSGKQNNNKLNT